MAKQYTESQKEIMRKLGLDESDFEPREKPVEETVAEIDAQVFYTAMMTDTLLEE